MKNLTIFTLKKNKITDFAKERNNLLKKSKSEMVLFLDSDEKITINKLQIDIIASRTNNTQITSYKLFRKNYFLGQYVGTDKIIRLVKKGTGKWVRAVHEVWKPDNPNLVGYIDTPIIHNTANSLKEYLAKLNNYSTLHARANLKEGKKSSLFKIIFFPIGKFMVTLFRSRHVVFSIMQSLHSFLSWTKLYFLQH